MDKNSNYNFRLVDAQVGDPGKHGLNQLALLEGARSFSVLNDEWRFTGQRAGHSRSGDWRHTAAQYFGRNIKCLV